MTSRSLKSLLTFLGLLLITVTLAWCISGRKATVKGQTLARAVPAKSVPKISPIRPVSPSPKNTPSAPHLAVSTPAGNRPADLQSQVLSRKLEPEQRRQSLAQLTEIHTREAYFALGEIARSPIPKTANRKFEVGLRITALEALDDAMNDTQGTISEKFVTSMLEKVLAAPTAPLLKFLASVSLSGYAQGRPGKLTRFIDRTFSVVAEN